MIYLVVGVSADKSVGLLSSGTNLQYATSAFNAMYSGYVKVQFYLINIHTQSLTLIGER